MEKLLTNSKIVIGVALLTLFPVVAFAQSVDDICSSSGYTIVTINGVLTDESGAISNRDSLKRRLPDFYHGEKLSIKYLLNPIHSGGVGDLFNAVTQKTFEKETVADYDLIEMLNDASLKVKTQKLLLVAHSQGNFYANSFHDVVTTQPGGVPAQSIGVYGVANPASRVAGGGKWLTSSTDKVIAWVVGNVPFRSIMEPNTDIELKEGDDFSGHGFSEVYLQYRAERIVNDIQHSLDKLSENSMQTKDLPCISPPEITLTHKQQKIVYALSDPILNPVGEGALWTLGKGVNGVALAAEATVLTAKFAYETTTTVAKWTYNTTIAAGKFVGSAVVKVGSVVYNSLSSTVSRDSFAEDNSASLPATLLEEKSETQLSPTAETLISRKSIVPAPESPRVAVQQAPSIPPKSPVLPQSIIVEADTKSPSQTSSSAPRLVFVGSWSGGGSGASTQQQASSQVLGSQSSTDTEDEAEAGGGVVGGADTILSAPTISASQCAETLATDGCLLSTTTVRLAWPAVLGASFYELSINGAPATTTETTHEILLEDFSDYTLEVLAIDSSGQRSATSTQSISVATIPIAINEIAWMGTVASFNDEWFEIKNNTTRTIDLSLWELSAKEGTPHVKMSGTIAPRAYLVFERTDDTTLPGIEAHQTYAGAFGNSGDQLSLSYASTTFDRTPEIVGEEWAAGVNSTTTRQTMERYSSRESGEDIANWGTNLGYIKNGTDVAGNDIEGTPGFQNSVSTLVNGGNTLTHDVTLSPDEEMYVIADNLRVSTSSTLTIEQGVTLKFYSGDLNINGQLVVAGTAENPVTIESLEGNTGSRIVVGGSYVNGVYEGENATAILDHVNAEGIEEIVARDNSIVEILNTDFSNSAQGIAAYSTSSVLIASSTIRDVYDNHAIAGYNHSQIVIENSQILNTTDNDAIGLYNGSMTISSTTIDGVTDDSGISVYNGTLTVASSTIKNVSDYGISLYQSTSTISNTNIENGYYSGIDIYKGNATITDTNVSGFEDAGISVYDTTVPVVITGGEVSNNSIGVIMDEGSATLVGVSVHDNGIEESDNVVVW